MSHAPSAPPPAPAPLYERDLYAWSQEQARLLRAGRLSEIDAENIAEEILDLGSNQYDKLESALRVLFWHMLKWDHQPEQRSASWEATIREQRNRIGRQLRRNPGLKSRLREAIEAGYEDGRLRAAGETEIDLDRFPEQCPYQWDEVLNGPFSK